VNTPLDWSALRDFLAVAETGSLSRAAKKLRLSQPTLSRRIAGLEAQLKAQLFQRTPRGLVLTEAGDKVLSGARRVEQEALAIERQAEAAQAALTGTVRISLAEILGALWLPPRLAAFHAQYPALCIEVLVDNRAVNLVRREADIAVRMFRPEQPDLIAKKVGTMYMGLYGSREYFARRGEPQTKEDLKDHTLVGFDESMSQRPPVQRLEAMFTRDRIVHRSTSFIGQFQATLAGIGLGVHECISADADPQLKRVLPGDVNHPLEVWLVTHEDMRRSPRVRAVFDYLETCFTAEKNQLQGMAA
jgi:DNA-binding transcriptional LysR family regulator